VGLSEGEIGAVGEFIRRSAGARQVRTSGQERLGGGAIQDNFGLDLEIEGGSWAGTHRLVLRTDAPSTLAVSLSRVQEFAVLRAAAETGVTVPKPLWSSEDPGIIGRPFCIMERVSGSASPRGLVRDGLGDLERATLVGRLGAELARLHRIRPPRQDLSFLRDPPDAPALARVSKYRAFLDELTEPRPVIEYGLHWLERHSPDDEEVVLCHCDFRTGNYMVNRGSLTGILDWEFAGWSDPHEDLGWFCARCWRFGAWEREAGGVGPREAFLSGYETETGHTVSRRRVLYWEVMAAVRWGIIALQQAQRHILGEQTSLELALTGRMVAEMELDILEETRRINGEASDHE